MRRCVYTALYGAHDQLPEQPVRAFSGLDFIAFVGDPAIRSETWEIRHLPALLPDDPVRSSRFPKLLPHRVLPEYDASLYIDCTVRLAQPPEALFADLLDGHSTTMACLRHHERFNVLDEALAVIELGYDDPAVCLAQVAAYRRAGLTGGVPMIWGGMLLRNHANPVVTACMERWFAHVLRYSRRDQLSFPYVAEELGFPFVAHPYSSLASPWHSWPHPRERSRAAWTAMPSEPVPVRSGWVEGALDGHSLRALLDHMEQAEMRLAQAHAALTTMRASRIWRATAGVRAVGNAVRRTRARLRAATPATMPPAMPPLPG